jgi:hypothetical protein
VYCKEHPDDPLCKCVNSPLKDSSFPVGCDVNCTRHSGTYISNVINNAIAGGCNYIDCKQYNYLQPEQQAVIDDVRVSQDCNIDRSKPSEGRAQETEISSTNPVDAPTSSAVIPKGEQGSGAIGNMGFNVGNNGDIDPKIIGIGLIFIIFVIMVAMMSGGNSSSQLHGYTYQPSMIGHPQMMRRF